MQAGSVIQRIAINKWQKCNYSGTHIQCRHSRTHMTSAKDVCFTITVYARAQRRACTVACGHRGSIRRMQYRQQRDHRGAFYTASCRMPSTSTDSRACPPYGRACPVTVWRTSWRMSSSRLLYAKGYAKIHGTPSYVYCLSIDFQSAVAAAAAVVVTMVMVAVAAVAAVAIVTTVVVMASAAASALHHLDFFGVGVAYVEHLALEAYRAAARG